MSKTVYRNHFDSIEEYSNPFFYVIYCQTTDRYYAGIRFSKRSDIRTFMKPGGYQTSSKSVHRLIEEHSLESFEIRRIVTFDNKEDVIDHETRFLQKVNASRNPKFINHHNNEATFFITYSSQPGWKEELNAIHLERYGQFYTGTDEYKEKAIKTNLERYGAEYYLSSDECKERRLVFLKENFGEDIIHYSQTDEYKEKYKKTNLERFGCENPGQSEVVKEQMRKTNMERYGVEYAAQSEVAKEQIKKTNLERYGVEYTLQAPEVREKTKKTLQERYGVENVSQSPEIRRKVEETNIKKFGYAYPAQNPENKRRQKEYNNLKRQRPIVLHLNQIKEDYDIKSVTTIAIKGYSLMKDEKLEQLYQTVIQLIEDGTLKRKGDCNDTDSQQNDVNSGSLQSMNLSLFFDK